MPHVIALRFHSPASDTSTLLQLTPLTRRLTRTGPTEITLTWKHPASSDPIDSYRIQITFVHQSEDRAFLHEVARSPLCDAF